MTRLLSHTVRADDAGQRLDALLAARGLYPSRSAAARAVEEGAVCVNGATVTKRHAVSAGDTIVYEAPDEPARGPVAGQPIDLDVRFEDEHLIVLSKQAGLVCHPSADHCDGTLVNALVHRCGADHLCNVQGEDDRLGIVHRLDRDTTGLMLAAKDDATGYALMADIRDRAVGRRYLALVHGVVAHDTGMVDAPIARSAHDRTRMAVRDAPSAREAVTTFRVLERFEHGARDDGYTLVDCKLFTGRTHQIRVHMAWQGHPLFNDERYGGDRILKGTTFAKYKQFIENCFALMPRHALHARTLGFAHPRTGEELRFESALPEDFRQLVEKWDGYTASARQFLDDES